MGPTPMLEMARAYGLRPRLWLLDQLDGVAMGSQLGPVLAIFLCHF